MDLDAMIKERDIIDYNVKDPELEKLIDHVLRKIPDKYREDFPMFSIYQTKRTNMGCAYVGAGDNIEVSFNADMLEKESGGNDDVKIGVIAHELAHVYLKHLPAPSDGKGLIRDAEADAKASEWGFKKEVKTFRDKLGPPTIK